MCPVSSISPFSLPRACTRFHISPAYLFYYLQHLAQALHILYDEFALHVDICLGTKVEPTFGIHSELRILVIGDRGEAILRYREIYFSCRNLL